MGLHGDTGQSHAPCSKRLSKESLQSWADLTSHYPSRGGRPRGPGPAESQARHGTHGAAHGGRARSPIGHLWGGHLGQIPSGPPAGPPRSSTQQPDRDPCLPKAPGPSLEASKAQQAPQPQNSETETAGWHWAFLNHTISFPLIIETSAWAGKGAFSLPLGEHRAGQSFRGWPPSAGWAPGRPIRWDRTRRAPGRRGFCWARLGGLECHPLESSVS